MRQITRKGAVFYYCFFARKIYANSLASFSRLQKVKAN